MEASRTDSTRRSVLILAVLGVLCAALAAAMILTFTPPRPAGRELPTTRVQIGNQPFTLEIADNPRDQEIGLMHREHLDADHGMLFVFPDSRKRQFWNHDVAFPLDLIFLDGDGVVVSIKGMQAYRDLDISSDFPAQYAIELNADTARRLGLIVGARLSLPADLIKPAR